MKATATMAGYAKANAASARRCISARLDRRAEDDVDVVVHGLLRESPIRIADAAT
jgi:hypothetical protein